VHEVNARAGDHGVFTLNWMGRSSVQAVAGKNAEGTWILGRVGQETRLITHARSDIEDFSRTGHNRMNCWFPSLCLQPTPVQPFSHPFASSRPTFTPCPLHISHGSDS